MNAKFYFRSLLMLASLLLTVALTACSNDDTESQVTIRYATISDIGPSMSYTSEAPSYHGAAPSEFAIEGVTFGGAAFDDKASSFTINPASGSLIIANTNELLTGEYVLSISCMAGGQRNFFPDIVSIRMLAGTPMDIGVTPDVLEIPYDGAKDSKLTAQVASLDESVTINQFELIQEEGKAYFTISKTGVIGINAAFTSEILPGVYTPVLKLSSLAGTAAYENKVTLKITSKPLEIAYKPAVGSSEINMAFTSPVPTLNGSTDGGVQWAIGAVTPETDKFTIDPATGVISLGAENGLAVGDVYNFDLTVGNNYGSTDFAAPYSIKIVAFITPIDPATFAYTATDVTEACAFEIEKKEGFVGDEVNFELGELPAALQGQIVLDDQTGKISASKGNSIPVGTHEIPVKAVNTKGPQTAIATITVQANPNMFTRFGYGNNLGLDVESNADQFRYEATPGADVKVTVPVGDNDFNGRDVKFKMEYVHNWAFRTKVADTFINEATGELSATFRNDRDGQIGVIRVTATIGEGETAVSRTVVLFLKTSPAIDKAILYTPFVLRVDPRDGGSSVAPTFGAGVDKSKVFISLKRNVFYYNLDGPETHISGQLAPTEQARFIYKMWGAYFGSLTIQTPNNAGSREPMTYYTMVAGDNSPATNLSAKLGYIDPTNDFKMVIHPNKWIDADNKAANGVLVFQAPYSTAGDFAAIDASGTKTFTYPIAVWFDEKF